MALQLSPGEILHAIGQLREMGFAIEATPTYGFRLARPIERLTGELLGYELGTRRVGRKILVHEVCESTNDAAWSYVGKDGYDGLVVFAERQRCGRGRFGRRWSSGPGSSILCSILLQNAGGEIGENLTLSAGLAAAEAVEEVFPLQVRIKWPNDVVLAGRKLAGIMVESRRDHNGTSYVIGIGINCQQKQSDFEPELQEKATSIAQMIAGPVDRLQLAQQLLRRLD